VIAPPPSHELSGGVFRTSGQSQNPSEAFAAIRASSHR
jgi:hypothetical protein